MESSKSKYIEHFYELKRRIIYVFVFFILAFGVSYYYSDQIYSFLANPLVNIANNSTDFIYTNLTDTFFVKLEISFKTAITIILPYILFHIYSFVEPGLYKSEKIFLKFAVIASPVLFLFGILFVYYFVMPNAIAFFLSFEEGFNDLNISFLAKMDEYVSLVSSFIFAFSIAFQMPILLLIFISLRILSSEHLINNRRISIVFIFIVAAILTPPDILSQFLLALPLLALYELTICFAKKIEKRRKDA